MTLKNLRLPSWKVLSALIMGLSLAACQGEAASNKTIYSAQSIITIDADNPVATAVVIDETGIIAEVGDLKALKKRHKGVTGAV